MAQMLGEKEDAEHIQKVYDKAWNSFEQLWREDKNKKADKLEYYVTCFDPKSGNTNTDVWTSQLDALWYLTAIGEPPAIPDERVKKILKTIFNTNRSFMGWAMCKTKDGEAVTSEQGQDVYTTSNYVLAQLLDYYGMVEESKEVYKYMDRVVFNYANTLTTPDNLRAELEQEAVKPSRPTLHCCSISPTRAVWTHLVMNHIKDLKAKNKTNTIEPKDLIPFYPWLMSTTKDNE
jgi:uncharacterized protein (DUF608 family)